MKFTIDSTSHRVRRKLHLEFDSFEEACLFFNRVYQRPVCDVLLVDVHTGEVLAIKRGARQKRPNYYSEEYRVQVSRTRPYRKETH